MEVLSVQWGSSAHYARLQLNSALLYSIVDATLRHSLSLCLSPSLPLNFTKYTVLPQRNPPIISLSSFSLPAYWLIVSLLSPRRSAIIHTLRRTSIHSPIRFHCCLVAAAASENFHLIVHITRNNITGSTSENALTIRWACGYRRRAPYESQFSSA